MRDREDGETVYIGTDCNWIAAIPIDLKTGEPLTMEEMHANGSV